MVTLPLEVVLITGRSSMRKRFEVPGKPPPLMLPGR
jgi:hypothetical protein